MKKITLLIFSLITILLVADNGKQISESNKLTGMDIISKVCSNIGNVETFKNIYIENFTKQEIDGGELGFDNNVLIVFPDNIRLQFGDQEFIIKGSNGWIKYRKKAYFEKLPANINSKMRKSLKKNLIYLCKYYQKLSINHIDDIMINNKKYHHLRINDYGYDIYVDAETLLPKEIHYQDENGKIIKKFESYKNFGDLLYPAKIITIDENENLISEITVKSIEKNIDLNKDNLK